MRKLVGMPLVLVLVAAAPPSSPSTPPAAAPEAGTPSTAGADAIADAMSSLKIQADTKLVDAGSEPRSLLRFAPKPGASATIETSTSLSTQATLTQPGAAPVQVPMPAIPPMISRTTMTVGKPAATGFVTVHVAPADVKVGPGGSAIGRDAATGAASDLGQIAFDILVDPSGVPVQIDVSGDNATADLMQGLSDQITSQMPQLPKEPVGPGAVWTTTLHMNVSGLAIDATQTSTLVAVTRDGVDIDVKMTMQPAAGALALPGLPPGVTVDLKKFAGQGGGQMHVDLATLSNTGEIDMDIAIDLAMAMAGQTQLMSMTEHEAVVTKKVK